MTVVIHQGDCREVLRSLPDESVHCVVTSPPYWGLRDYGVSGQLGLEQTPDQYVAGMVEVFREVRRVLRSDGTLWLNLGDSYNAQPGQRKTTDKVGEKQETNAGSNSIGSRSVSTLKPKDLVGIPWRVAFALQADGWWLRQDIIWAKPNPMPESVRDRCTKSHEYLFLLTKSATYFCDMDAIAEEGVGRETYFGSDAYSTGSGRNDSGQYDETPCAKRNKRSVWTVTTQPFSEAHFATFPPALIEPCILAGTSAHGCCSKCGAPWERDVERESILDPRPMTTGQAKREALGGMARTTPQGRTCGSAVATTTGWSPGCECEADVDPCVVLDVFGGAGTTGLVADRHHRNAILIELNPEYAAMAKRRIEGDSPLFARVTA